jgi:hypothetical protein
MPSWGSLHVKPRGLTVDGGELVPTQPAGPITPPMQAGVSYSSATYTHSPGVHPNTRQVAHCTSSCISDAATQAQPPIQPRGYEGIEGEWGGR